MSEGRYFAELCLAQVVVDDPDAEGGKRIEVIDTLGPHDPQPIADLLADRQVEVVMHAAGQDVGILKRAWKTPVTNLFDTQVAAGFTGASAQAGYGPLLSQLLGVNLHKSASFTRWDARPLSKEQVRYAREDVEHLLELTDAIQDKLAKAGRLEWAREECRRLEDVTSERDPETAFRKLPKASQLKPRVRAVARELAAWRERTAQSENKPIGSIVNDAVLVEAARRQPTDLAALEQIRGVHQGIIRRRGREILAAVERGLQGPPLPNEERQPLVASADDIPVINLTEALTRTRAREAGLAYELVASRSDLSTIVVSARNGGGEPEVRTLQGWRRELVGAELLELLKGRRSLSVGTDARVRVEDGAWRSPTS